MEGSCLQADYRYNCIAQWGIFWSGRSSTLYKNPFFGVPRCERGSLWILILYRSVDCVTKYHPSSVKDDRGWIRPHIGGTIESSYWKFSISPSMRGLMGPWSSLAVCFFVGMLCRFWVRFRVRFDLTRNCVRVRFDLTQNQKSNVFRSCLPWPILSSQYVL